VKNTNQNLHQLLTQGEPLATPVSSRNQLSISELENRFINLLAKELGVFAIEFLTVVNPVRANGERKITNHYFTRVNSELGARSAVETKTMQDFLHHFRVLNKKGQDIYLRPSFSQSGVINQDCCIRYRYFTLDDVSLKDARQISERHRCIVVKTSEQGGYQVWVVTNRPITIGERYQIQKYFADKGISDPGATSGVQYFRCAGFKNHKRNGQWINMTHAPKKHDVMFDVDAFFVIHDTSKKIQTIRKFSVVIRPEDSDIKKNVFDFSWSGSVSQSERDWKWVSERLNAGASIEALIYELNSRSIPRGKHRSYAERTVRKCARWLGIRV